MLMNRKIVNFLFISYVLFVVYNTLIPFTFDYSVSDFPKLLDKVVWNPLVGERGHISLTDLAGNVILFIPFGFFLYMVFYSHVRRHPIFWSVVLGALLSLFIEFVQLFIQSRNTAPHDFINNTIGSFLGAGIAAVYSLKISAIARKIFYELLDRKPFLLLVVFIGLLQLIASVMPFTVSITYSDLAESAKDTNLIPFAYMSVGKLFFNSPNQHDQLPFETMAFINDMLFWIVVSYLLMLCYRIYWKEKVYGKILFVGLPLLYFPMTEFMQMFIISRITDINDIISGYLGFALGVALYYLLRPIRRKTFHHHLDLLKIPLLMYGFFILFSGLQPFDWSFDLEFFKSNLHAYSLVPFYAYYKTTSLWNIYDLINSLTFFLPISLYWTYRLRQKAGRWPAIYLRTVLAGLIIGLFIEVMQLFSVARVAEITDALAYGMGGALGTFLIYYYEKQLKAMLEILGSDSEVFSGRGVDVLEVGGSQS